MDLVPKEYKMRSDIVAPANGNGGASANKATLTPSSVGRRNGFKIVVLASFVLLLLTILAEGGLLIYKSIILSDIKKLQSEQAAVYTPQEKDLAGKVIELEKRADAVHDFLRSHIYTSEILNVIAASTLPLVKWDSYKLGVKGTAVNLKGRAADYKTLAKQIVAFEEVGLSEQDIVVSVLKDKLQKSEISQSDFDQKLKELSYFSNIKVSGIALDKKGGVSFSLDFNFDPKIIKK